MKKGMGKNKGSAFERLICKELSLWLSEGKENDIFMRSMGSGSRATLSKKKGGKKEFESQSGDIALAKVHKMGEAFLNKFVVECKNYNNIHIDSLLYHKGTLYDFWKKLIENCNWTRKYPLLVFKEIRKPIMVCTKLATLLALTEPNPLDDDCKIAKFKIGTRYVAMLEFETFCKHARITIP